MRLRRGCVQLEDYSMMGGSWWVEWGLWGFRGLRAVRWMLVGSVWVSRNYYGIPVWNAAKLETNFVFTILRNNEGQHWIKRGWVSLKSFIMAREISVTACPFPEDWRRKTWLWSGRRACAVWLWTWLWGMCSRRRQVPWTLKKLSGNHDFRFGITFEKKKKRNVRAKMCEYAKVWGDSNVITLREEERTNAMETKGRTKARGKDASEVRPC